MSIRRTSYNSPVNAFKHSNRNNISPSSSPSPMKHAKAASIGHDNLRNCAPRTNSGSSSVSPKARRHKEAVLAAKNVPVSMRSHGQLAVSLPNRTEAVTVQLAVEAQEKLMGPMPVKKFLRAFLPPIRKDNPIPDTSAAFDNVPLNAKEEHELCMSLVEAVEKGGRCSSVKMFNTSSFPRRSGKEFVDPEITGYARGDVKLLHQEDDGTIPSNSGLAEIICQVRLDHDPFCDRHHHAAGSERRSRKSFLAYQNHATWYDKDARRERRNFGQMVAFVTEACARQHRTFFFSVMIIGTRARLFRWDRAGVIVTESFDYRQDPRLLCSFLWQFHLANPVERGLDPTVSVASKQEEWLFKRLIAEEVAFQLGIDLNDKEKLDEALKVHYQEGRVKRIKVYEPNRSLPEVYLVSVPVKSPSSAFGSGTRGYWSVRSDELGKGEVVFLKDTWCIEVPIVTDEGSVYEDMRGKVLNIPELHIHGFVPNDEYEGFLGHRNRSNGSSGYDHLISLEPSRSVQCTRTQDFINDSWVCECLRVNYVNDEDDLGYRVVKHKHYRLVLNEVGYPLQEFSGSLELFEAARDALEALTSAHDNCGRLHRDVSLGNIILVRCRSTSHRKGLLIDWQLSTQTDETGRTTDSHRFGTWAFMSGAALRTQDPDFRHAQEDDLESLFYVVMYGSLRWLPHNEMRDLGAWMYNLFDYSTTSNGHSAGGVAKRVYADSSGDEFNRLFTFENTFVRIWFKHAYEYLGTNSVFRKRYGLPSQWTAENLRKLFEVVCRGLSNTEGATKDKCEHDVESFRPTPERFPHDSRSCSTCASTLDSSDSGSTCTSDSIRTPDPDSFFATGSMLGTGTETSHRSRKRMLVDVDDGESELNNDGSSNESLRAAKRVRVDRHLRYGAPSVKRVVRRPSQRTDCASAKRQSCKPVCSLSRPQAKGGSDNANRKEASSCRTQTPVTISTKRPGLRRSARLAAKAALSNLRPAV